MKKTFYSEAAWIAGALFLALGTAMMERADRTSEYISQVAAFFRYNIQENDEVTLAQEIQLVDLSKE